MDMQTKTYCYLLECADGSFYCGWCIDPHKRLVKHQSGTGSRYTRSRLPVKLVYFEECSDRSQAMRREWEIKKMTRPQKMSLIRSFRHA
jgi:putative endonuclease